MKPSVTSAKRLMLSFSSFAVLASSGLALPAIAQDETEARLADVIVTAQRKEEGLQDVPLSVATLSGDKLDVLKSGGADIRFLSARVPSLVIESSFGRTFPRFYLRGLGNTDFDLNASQPVSIVYDEVVLENPVLKGFPVFDVEQIEVLRGPQGTLFGRNTPAGIIKFDSVKPSQEASGYLRGAAGSFGALDIEGAYGMALTDTLSMRASVLFQSQDGWVDNLQTGENDAFEDYSEFAGRLQFLYEPTAQFSALLNIHGRSGESTSRVFRANILAQGTGGLAASFDREGVFFDGGGGNNQDIDTFGVTGRVAYDFGGVTLTSVTGYETVEFFGRGDIDGGAGAVFLPTGSRPGVIAFPADTADGINDLTQFSQEFRLSSNGDQRLDWQAGLYYFSEEVEIITINYDTLANDAVNGRVLQNQETTSIALFASATYELTDALTLAGGLRYTDEEKDYLAERFIGPIGNGASGPVTADVGDSALSWDASLTYALNENVNVYGRVATGFRAPAIQGRILFAFGTGGVSVGDSETVTSFEAGIKSSLFEDRARVNVSVFSYEIEDQQLTAIGGASNANTLLNADKGVGKGFEVDVEALPFDFLQVTAGLSYNDTEIQDAGLTTVGCGSACTIYDPFVRVPNPFAADGDGFDEIVSIDGNPFPNAPKWIGNFTARLFGKTPNGGEIYAFTDWAYKGDTNFFLYQSFEFQQKGYWEGGLRVGYIAPSGRYELAAFGRNITDEVAVTGGIDFNNLTGFINEPRRWGVEAKVNF